MCIDDAQIQTAIGSTHVRHRIDQTVVSLPSAWVRLILQIYMYGYVCASAPIRNSAARRWRNHPLNHENKLYISNTRRASRSSKIPKIVPEPKYMCCHDRKSWSDDMILGRTSCAASALYRIYARTIIHAHHTSIVLPTKVKKEGDFYFYFSKLGHDGFLNPLPIGI